MLINSEDEGGSKHTEGGEGREGIFSVCMSCAPPCIPAQPSLSIPSEKVHFMKGDALLGIVEEIVDYSAQAQASARDRARATSILQFVRTNEGIT